MTNSTRKKPSENIGLILFAEVDGLCPKCNKPLMSKSKSIRTKIYEVAHIYPNSPRPNEVELLKDEEILNSDVDHEDNLIALCRDCHKIFDNPRTVEGYREMVEMKKELQRISRIKNGWHDSCIDDDINNILNSLVLSSGESLVELSLHAMKVSDKADETLLFLTKRKIEDCVRYYYSDVKSKFAELDKVKPYSSDLIYSQVKTYYIKLKKEGHNQNQIFSALTSWLGIVTGINSVEACEILVSFFVQNCEVYS